jgi:hypothetical protein
MHTGALEVWLVKERALVSNPVHVSAQSLLLCVVVVKAQRAED